MSDTRSSTPWWRDRLLVGTAIVFALWSALALTWPLSGDAGVFAWMADTVHRGGAPYVDAWDTKGPAAWLPSLLVQSLFGRTAWGIRLFDIGMVLCAVTALRAIARRLGQPGAGRVAIALYALWYASLDFWQSAQPDGWVATWLVVACWCVIAGGSVRAGIAGALIGLATLVKPFYIGYAVVVWMIIAFATDRTTPQRIMQSVLVAVGIGVAIAALLLATRAWGGLDGFWEVQRWNRDVYARLGDPWLTRIPAMFKGMLLMPWGIVGPLALFGAIRPTRAHRRTIAALGLGFLGAVAGVIVQGKGWMYHWLPMLPFLALLADIGFAALREEVAGEIAGRFRRLALLLALTVAVLTPVQQVYRFARSRASTDARVTYERREFRYYGRYPGSAYEIIDSLARLEPGRARILLWAMHPAPYLLANLTPPTRFAVIRPLYDGAGTAERAAYRSMFAADLDAHPPRWWVMASSDLLTREDELRGYRLGAFSAAADVLQRRYRLAGETADWMIYERTDAANGRTP